MILQQKRDENGLPLETVYTVTDRQIGSIISVLRNINSVAQLIELAQELGTFEPLEGEAGSLQGSVKNIQRIINEITK